MICSFCFSGVVDASGLVESIKFAKFDNVVGYWLTSDMGETACSTLILSSLPLTLSVKILGTNGLFFLFFLGLEDSS